MTPDIVAELRARGVALWVEGDSLHYRAPRGALTPELRTALADHKAELMNRLRCSRSPKMLRHGNEHLNALGEHLWVDRLDAAAADVLIREAFAPVVASYVEGALAVLEADRDLAKRYRDTEATVDAAARAGTEGPLRAAVAAHVAVIGESVARRRAQLEAIGSLRTGPKQADMPELQADAVTAVGVRYIDAGEWVSVQRERRR